jgi:hypothetical protein
MNEEPGGFGNPLRVPMSAEELGGFGNPLRVPMSTKDLR